MTDPQLHDRLHRVADPIDIDPEAHLDSLHAGARAHARRRRVAGLAAGVAVTVLVAAAAWQLRPSSTRVAAGTGSPTGTLAYVDMQSGYEGGDIMTLHAKTFGGDDVKVPFTGGTDPLIVYSPDGTRFAYAQRAGDGTAITIADADGSNLREIGIDLGAEQISWGPDGTTMAFLASDGTTGRTEVSILDLDTGAVTPLPLQGGNWRSIAWSPDGRFIALAGHLQPAAEGDAVRSEDSGLFIAPSDGSAGLKPLVTNAQVEFLDWAPDSSKISYGVHDATDGDDYRWDVWVIGADGSNPTQLTDEPGWDNIAVWSPDGQWIAFSSDRDASPAQQGDNAVGSSGTQGGFTIYLMHPDGTDVTPLFAPSDAVLMAPIDWKA